MTTSVFKEEHKSSVTEDEEKELRKDFIKKSNVITEYIKSIREEQGFNTSSEKEKEQGSIDFVLPIQTFYEQIIVPMKLLEFSEEKKEGKEEELKFLHDYVVDDLSVEYHSAKKFHEYIRSLRKQHGIEKSF